MADQQLLSIRQAAELTGLRRKVIRDRVTRGDIDIRLIGSGRGAKVRLTESALVEAGLLSGVPKPVVRTDEFADLMRLVREQQARITTLEDQRFQLAGQLGAALERTLALQNQLIELTASVQSHSPFMHEIKRVEPSPSAEQTVDESPPEPEAQTHAGLEDASLPMDGPPQVPSSSTVRVIVGRMATSKSAQRGKAQIARLRAIQLRHRQ